MCFFIATTTRTGSKREFFHFLFSFPLALERARERPPGEGVLLFQHIYAVLYVETAYLQTSDSFQRMGIPRVGSHWPSTCPLPQIRREELNSVRYGTLIDTRITRGACACCSCSVCNELHTRVVAVLLIRVRLILNLSYRGVALCSASR